MEDVFDAANEAQVEQAQEKVELARRQLLEDLKEITSRKSGVRFIRHILEQGRVFQTTFTGNSHSFFLEGHRNLALKILNDVLEAAPEIAASLLVGDREEGKVL